MKSLAKPPKPLKRSVPRHWALGHWAALAVLAAVIGGCEAEPAPPPAAMPYLDQGYKPGLAPFMRGTVFERSDVGNVQPYPVSGYSLVVNLQGTGDNSAIPTAVRQALLKRMSFAGFGQLSQEEFADMKPEQVLADKRVAVVEVIGLLPVGSRRGDHFDILVRAMPRSRTTSLAHGELYNTELRNRGLEQPQGGGPVLAYADGGPVLVNPVYSLNGPTQMYPGVEPSQVIASLRSGSVLDSGTVTEDRAILMQFRVPQASIARTIERRINTRLPQPDGERPAASAQDEGLIDLYVPRSFHGNWQHFIGIVNHLYVNESPDFAVRKVRELMAAADQPNVDLNDITYCLEALGPSAVPIYQPMLSDRDPAVVFAAARAALFCGDDTGLNTLLAMANMDGHPFQLAAVRALGELPATTEVDKQLEPLLGSSQTLVRVNAYRILAEHNDRRIVSRDLPSGFKLDIVDYPGSPLIYAVHSGTPRLAIFNPSTALSPPVVFSAMDDRMTIATDEMGEVATLFYRDPRSPKALKVQSGLTLEEVISRFGGLGPEDADHLDISYPETVAIMQALARRQMVSGPGLDGHTMFAPFMLEEPSELTDALVTAALGARPQADPLHAHPVVAPEAEPPTPGVRVNVSTGGPPPSVPAPADSGGTSPSPSVPSFGNP